MSALSELEQLLARQPTVCSSWRLREDGLVKTRRQGKTIYYSLAGNDVRIIVGRLTACSAATAERRHLFKGSDRQIGGRDVDSRSCTRSSPCQRSTARQPAACTLSPRLCMIAAPSV